MQNVTLSC